MVASGVRRSWDRAASTAVRTLSVCRNRSLCAACWVIRSLSTARTACAANTCTRRRSAGGSGRPYNTRVQPDPGGPAGTSTSAVFGSTDPSAAAGTSGPAWETTRFPPVLSVVDSSITDRMPNPTLACSSTARTGSVDSNTLVAAAATSCASDLPRAACRARSAERSTTDATVTPTTTKTTSAKAFSGSAMV